MMDDLDFQRETNKSRSGRYLSRRNLGALSFAASTALVYPARPASSLPIDIFKPTDLYAAQTQRLAAEAAYGAADMFEIEATSRTLANGDETAWDVAWTALAQKAENEANLARDKGYRTTAVARYFHAANYYRQSEMFFYSPDPRKTERFRRAQTAFRKAVELLSPQVRTIEVKCGNEVYDGYWCLPVNFRKGQRLPAVFLIGGADSYAEENYFSGLGLLQRGIAMLLLDTPGRGSSIYLKGIPTRPDYEVPVAAAFDWMERQPNVDKTRMGLVGISMGGYYAPRAAAFDQRCKGLVCWSGTMNLLEDLYLFNPPIQRQLQWITGSADDASARAKLAKFDLSEVADRITCPTMVVHGRNDRVMNVAGAERFFAALKVSDKSLHIMEGTGSDHGAGHCNYTNWSEAVPLMFDWMAEKLGALKAT